MPVRKIVTLSFENIAPDSFLEYADEVTIVSARAPFGMETVQDAIKKGMVRCLRIAEPGDVIAQDDMIFDRDPFESPLMAGTITMLNPRQNPRHWCPRAFRFAARADAVAVERAWFGTPLRSCYGWQSVPKQLYECGNTHGS